MDKSARADSYNIPDRRAKWTKGISYSLFILNAYYVARFLLTFWNRSAKLNTHSKIILLGFLILALFIAISSLKQRNIHSVDDYYNTNRSIYEIFISFLFLSQFFNWFLKHITSAAAFEIRGWFLSIYLWIVFSYLVIRLRSFLSQIPRFGIKEKGSLSDYKYRRLYITGMLLIGSLIISYWIYTQIYSPLPHYYNYDPEYAYMLSSTSPFTDTSLYMRMDHPGSIMQLLGSFFNLLLSPITLIQAGFPTYINLTHPEIFIYFARTFILMINLIAFAVLATKSIKFNHFQDLFAGLSIPLIYFSAHHFSLEFLTIWSPNSFNYALGTIVLLILLIYLTSAEEIKPQHLFFISLIAGVIATFQVYMISWGIGISTTIFVFYLLKQKNAIAAFQNLGLSLFHFIKGYILGTLVIFDQIESFLDWIFNITIHQGNYGGGKFEFINVNNMMTNLQHIVHDLPWFMSITGVLLICLAILLVISRKAIKDRPGILAISIGLIIQIGFIFVLVLKHPEDRYLLSAASILPILLTIIIILTQSKQTLSKFLYPAVFTILLINFGTSAVLDGKQHDERVQYVDTYQKEVTDFLADYAGSKGLETDDLTVYWTYSTYSECYSLWFGNEYAKNRFNIEIDEICKPKNEYAINIWSNKIIPADKNIKINQLDNKSVIIGDPGRLNQIVRDDFVEYPSPKIANLSFFIPKSPGQ